MAPRSRHRRTIILAILAALSFAGAAVFIFDVDPMLILRFFLISLAGLVIIVVAALATMLVFKGIKRLAGRLFGG